MKIIINDKTYSIVIAKTFKSKLIGLMGKKNINYGMLFSKINSIHTFFMKESIDVIALDSENRILSIKRNLAPCKIYVVKNKAKKTSILELPNNASISLNIGDKLSFISE